MKTLSLKFVLILTLLLAITSKECGNNDIEGCDICGTGINANKCSKCSSKYFSVFDGEKCIKCDDSILAMAGCGGNCKLLNKTERNVQCDENSCKEGFYEIFPGTCATCSFLSSDCTKCSYSKEEGSDEKIFKCLECKNYYYPSSDGYCYYGQLQYCEKYLNETHCLECYDNYALYPNGTCLYYEYECEKPIYSEEKNKVICSKYKDGYYLNPDGMSGNYIYSCLNAIYSQEKQSGICLQCKDGYYISSDSKSCEICRYVSKDYFSYCKKCHLDDSNDVLCEEISNNEYYIYNSGKNIRQCGSKISKCEKCSYNNEEGGDFNEENLLCDECQANTYLSADRKECKNCLVENGCIKCSDEDKNYCDKCSSGYSLYSDGSCAKCSDHFGAGCESCSLSIYDLSFYCESCSTGYVFGIDGKCKDCSNEEDVNLSNCNTCRNLGNNNYECLECKNQDYILFEGKCLSRTEIDEEFSLCNELVNLGTKDNKIYSCVKCRDSEYIFSVREDGSSICIQSSSLTELNYCSLSKRETLSDKSYNYTCIKCKDNNNRELKYDGDLKKETCQCISGYYQYNSGSTCRNCNFFIYNCQTCHEDNDDIICDTCFDNYVKTNYNSCTRCNIDSCEKCSFGEDNNLKCDKYKEPYFLSNESKIESCSSKIDYCVSCSYKDEKMTDLKCDKCLDNYFLNMNHECQKCYINTDFGPSCLSCTDNEKLKETAPCQKCQENYFLTKNNTCVYCKSERYGGMFCEQCGYISYNNKEKIGCLKCKNSYDYAITDEGKCFDIYNAKCKTAGSYINKNNEKVFGCTSCYDYYYLNDEHECISIPMENCLSLKVEDGIKLCTSCKNGYQLIENRCIQIIPEESNQKIEGCSYYNFKNNFYYCINCNSNYVLNNGYCFKIPNSPLLSKCSYYKINKNFIQCNSCSSYNYYYNHYINNKLVCTNILGQCSSMENIGTDFNPKYTCKSCPDDAEMEDDNGITHCVSNILKNRCVQGNINTYYYTNIYSCTKCDPLYILSYSSYDEKYICKYIYEEEKPKVDISKYANDKGVATTNGKCEDKYFTRNGKVCIKCDDNTYGMPGCGGNCQFNKDREYQLKCDENQCKEGYFETLPGQCKVCDSALSYCSQCSYINTNNEEISILPKRKRKLICNECKEGFILENGVCKTCSEIISGCSECIFENEQIKCKTTYPEYYFDIEGNIQRCQENCARCILENQKPKCLDASHGYFINNERKIISCSDEKEGMVGCYQCTFDTNLKCTYCYYKYELINNECKSIIELYKLDNCKYYHTFYNESKKFYQCYECENNYFLDVNTKKCIKSTEETKLCKSANVLKINDKIVYNCSNCINYDNSLVQNTDGFYSCYNQELTKLVSKDCQLIVNKGTFDEPIFSCERCSYYRYYKILVMNEYEIQYCEYNSYFITNCIKGTVRDYYSKNDYGETYTLEKEYNCTQCALKYELVYDNKTEKYTCNPLECGIPFCKKCKDNDVYTCEECLTGFTLNRLGLCYIKPPKPPTITFKDIFRFALNGNFELDGNNIFRYAYRLRGITTDSISDKHSFIIKTMFSSNNGLRALDDDTKALDTSCQFKEKMDSGGSDLKYVDYECSFDSVNEELSNHKMTSIKEDTEENDNMNAVNLEDLVNKVENIERKESTFNINELNKYVSFTVNEDSKQINATNNTNYAFIINGTTDKVISNKIIGKLEIIGSNENVNCEIDAKDKDKASIDCTTDMSEIIKQLGITQYSFKTREIISDNNNVYFNGLNDVKIIIPVEDQEVEPEEEEEGQKEKEKEPNNPENPEKSKKSNTGLIVGLVVGGVVVIGIITFLILFFKMRKNNNPISDMNNNDHNTNKDVVISYQAKNDQKGTSSNRNMN